MHQSVLICAITCTTLSVANAQITTVPRLDSATVTHKAPFLFCSDAEINRARENARRADMKPIFARLEGKAKEVLAYRPKPFPTQWWQQVKDKPWSDTYPEIYQHTAIEPRDVATPLSDLVTYYIISDEAQARDKAKALLLHLATFSFDPKHYDVGMNYSTWLYHALRAYDALLPYFDDAERARIDSFFTRGAQAVLDNDIYWIDNTIGGGINNHLAWHKLTIGLIGLFYDVEPMKNYALHARRNLIELLELGLVDDGLWCESSLVYQFAVVVPMVLYADALHHTGDDTLLNGVFADGRTVRQSVDAMFDVLFPNLVIPPIGDAYATRASLAKNPTYEWAWNLWRDPKYAWLIAQNDERPPYALFAPPLPETAPAPLIATKLFPEHGYAFLRTKTDADYWHSDALCAMLDYDKAGVHANADELSVMLFGNGRLLLPDVEGKATVPHAFSSRIQRELNRGALSQNTVMIDGQDQRMPPRRLDLIEYRDLPDEKRVTAADNDGLCYAGLRMQRTLALTDDYLLDVFQVDCAQPREITWVMHILSENAERITGPEMQPSEPPHTHGAWAWLRNFQTTKTNAAWTIVYEEGGVTLRLDMLAAPETTIYECGYPATDEPDTGTIPTLFVTRKTKTTTFATVYTTTTSAPTAVTIEQRQDRDGKMTYTVTCNNQRRLHFVPKPTN